MMQRQGGGIPAFLLVLIAVGVFGAVLVLNSRPSADLRVIVPTQGQPTEATNAWEAILQEGFGSDSTPLPTVAIPTAAFVAPTLALNGNATSLSPAELGGGVAQPQFSVGVA